MDILLIINNLWICGVLYEDKYFRRPWGIYTFQQFNTLICGCDLLSLLSIKRPIIHTRFLIWEMTQQGNLPYLWPGSQIQ